MIRIVVQKNKEEKERAREERIPIQKRKKEKERDEEI